MAIIEKECASVATAPGPLHMPQTTSPKCVMVVEDDFDIREAVTHVLEFSGFSVTAAANGIEALDLLRTKPQPNLILLDLMMPVMDGPAFDEERKRLSSSVAKIPVVILSADSDIRAKAVAMGVASYLKKPVEVDVLLQTVKRHCTA